MHLKYLPLFTNKITKQCEILKLISRPYHLNADEINKQGYRPFPNGFTTKIIEKTKGSEEWNYKPIIAPLVTSANFKHEAPAQFDGFTYSRIGNPTRNTLEKCLSSLENGRYGFCFSSGLGAVTSVLGLLKQGDHIICGDDIYAGVMRIFQKFAPQFGIEVTPVDACNITEIEEAMKPNTELIWVETPTNPTLKVADIEKICSLGKRNDILTVIDNTFATPFLQKPLDMGADMVMHSLTKYINGHSDVIMGAIITHRQDLKEKLQFIQGTMGAVPSPFDCYQVTRSLKTLELRMRKHMENGLAVAKFLESHPKIERVLYPGLPSHPQHKLYKDQTCGTNGMCSVYVKGKLEESKKFVESLKVFTLAESLGGFESLVNIPSIMTHASLPGELKQKLNITDNFIRISVGIEDTDDLLVDLERALDNI